MVDWNKLKGQAMNIADKTKEKVGEANELRKKSNQETKLKVTTRGFGSGNSTTVRKDVNGSFYLSAIYSEKEPRYDFENLEFAGSTVTQKTVGEVKKQGRVGSTVVGGLLAGGVGAVAGASRKRKDKVNTVTTQEEKPGKGTIYLRNQETGEIKTLKFLATQAEAENYLRFFGNI